MAEYIVWPARNKDLIFAIDALSARRAAERAACHLSDNGQMNGWNGGMRLFTVRNIDTKTNSKNKKEWTFTVMKSGDRFDVIGAAPR